MRALAEALWIAAVTPRRLRTSRPAICVGGAALGGTGKTPLAIAIAEYLQPRIEVAIVGHAHRAKPREARIVRTTDPLDEVGDEALLCARRVPTVVAPKRQAAIDLACEIADVILLDGVLQLEPRAALSILTLAGRAPEWLTHRADLALTVRSALDVRGLELASVGLATCLARPERVVRALENAGVRVVKHCAFRDHGPGGPLEPGIRWVATEKCALHLRSAPGVECDIEVLRHDVVLTPEIRACLDRLAPPPYSEIPRT